jgi:hypothetical protein
VTRDREGAPLGTPGGAPRVAAPPAGRTRRRWLRLWLVVAVLWAGVMAYACLRGWPTFPLDLPRNDPEIQAAFNRAIAAHAGRYALLALAPPLLMLILGWIVARITQPRA